MTAEELHFEVCRKLVWKVRTGRYPWAARLKFPKIGIRMKCKKRG